MTKADLMAVFPNFSPKRAFRRFGAAEAVTFEVTGKWVRVARLDSGAWDVWLCNAAELTRGMGTKRLNRLLGLVPEGVRTHVLDGEAYWQSADTGVVRRWLEAHRVALGISKRRPAPDKPRIAALPKPQRVEVRQG